MFVSLCPQVSLNLHGMYLGREYICKNETKHWGGGGGYEGTRYHYLCLNVLGITEGICKQSLIFYVPIRSIVASGVLTRGKLLQCEEGRTVYSIQHSH